MACNDVQKVADSLNVNLTVSEFENKFSSFFYARFCKLRSDDHLNDSGSWTILITIIKKEYFIH